MGISWALAVPVIVFLVIVMPTWLTLHYKAASERMRMTALDDGQVAVSKAELERLQRVALRLDERIEALERLLEAEHPQWQEHLGDKS